MASNLEVAQHLQAKHLSDIWLFNFQNDTAMIYLTTFMLGNIFSEKIACHNASYKELREKAFIEVGGVGFSLRIFNWTKIIQNGLDAPQPLDDVGEYIDYINQHCQAIKVSLGPAFLFLKNVLSAPGQFWREIIPHAF